MPAWIFRSLGAFQHFDTIQTGTKMITTTTKTAPLTLKGAQDTRLKVDGTDVTYGDWRDDLARDGYAVIKGAIPQERALGYADKMYNWLEGL